MRIIAFDFDGVIHSYTSGWKGIANIPDPPVPGIKEAIDQIRKAGYDVHIFSTRCTSPSGKRAIELWLLRFDIQVDAVTHAKPPAVCIIDDRAICFDGHPENLLKTIKGFKPWYRK